MAKNENSEHVTGGETSGGNVCRVGSAGRRSWRIVTHHWRILSDCIDRVWNF